jgi:hypothetical protein
MEARTVVGFSGRAGHFVPLKMSLTHDEKCPMKRMNDDTIDEVGDFENSSKLILRFTFYFYLSTK